MHMILTAEDCVCVGNILYFVSMEMNLVFSLRISDGEISIVDSIPDEFINSKRLGAKIVAWDNNLYLAPMNAKKIWKYDIQNKNWKGYELKRKRGLNDMCLMFQAVIHNNKIFFIGCNYPAITVLDLVSDTIEYIEGPYDEYRDLEYIENDVFFRTDCVMKNGFLYVASCLANSVLKLNLNSYEYEYIRIGDSNLRFSGIDYDGEFFYIAPRKKGPLIKWDGERLLEKMEIPYMSRKERLTFNNIVCTGEKVVLAMNAYTNDDNSFIISKSKDGKEKMLMPIKERFYFYRRIGENLVVSLNQNKLLRIVQEGVEYKYTMEIDDCDLRMFYENKMKDLSANCGLCVNDILEENNNIGLTLFLVSLGN